MVVFRGWVSTHVSAHEGSISASFRPCFSLESLVRNDRQELGWYVCWGGNSALRSASVSIAARIVLDTAITWRRNAFAHAVSPMSSFAVLSAASKEATVCGGAAPHVRLWSHTKHIRFNIEYLHRASRAKAPTRCISMDIL